MSRGRHIDTHIALADIILQVVFVLLILHKIRMTGAEFGVSSCIVSMSVHESEVGVKSENEHIQKPVKISGQL